MLKTRLERTWEDKLKFKKEPKKMKREVNIHTCLIAE